MHIRTAIFLSSNFLKLAAIIVAYFLWSMLSDLYVINGTYTVPVYIKNSNNVIIKDAPSQATVTLCSHRKNLRAIDKSNLAICIDDKCLAPGTNVIKITNEHLSLPSSINVVDYNPINFTVVTACPQPSPTPSPVVDVEPKNKEKKV